jgi:hypothetical protein
MEYHVIVVYADDLDPLFSEQPTPRAAFQPVAKRPLLLG